MTPSATTSASCPGCGRPTTGNFCSHCGTPLKGATCPACDATLSAGARFCHVCGRPMGARRGAGPVLPWAIAGAAVVALGGGFLYLNGRDAAPPAAAQQASPFAGGAAGGRAAPDISSMTPREQADRLFERIVMAHERGDTGEVRFFRPMALQAYQQLAPLDHDARYHVGLIHTLTGNPEAALAQADSITADEPGHLLAAMLRQRAAIALGDAAGGRMAYRDFLASYEAEVAANRPEYQAHEPVISAFLAEARRAVGEGSGS